MSARRYGFACPHCAEAVEIEIECDCEDENADQGFGAAELGINPGDADEDAQDVGHTVRVPRTASRPGHPGRPRQVR